MPFQSEKQRRYLWANEPEIAREWTDRYGAANGGIFDQWGQHATATEAMKLMNEPDYHQKAGYNFMQNFPDTPQWLADTLATGYQYGSEGFKALKGGTDFGEALDRAKEEARLNRLGIRGLGFDMGEYENFMDNYNSANESSTPEISFVPNALNQASIYPSNLYPGTALADVDNKILADNLDIDNEWTDTILPTKRGIMDVVTDTYNVAKDDYVMPAIGVMGMLANKVNPLNPKSTNYNAYLQNQVDFLNDQNMLGDQSSPYKITSGPLAGKNLVSGFGTNDYGKMLQKRIDYFRNKKSLTKLQNKKMHEAIAEKERIEKENAKREAELRSQVRQQAAANKAAGTGGYQSSFGKDEGFMGGSGTSDDMGSFAEGGLANLWHRK